MAPTTAPSVRPGDNVYDRSTMMATAARMQSTPAFRDAATRRAMLLAVPDLMFLLTRDGVYLDYYARDRRKLFVPPEVFLGKNVREILPHDLASEFVRAFARVTPSGDPVEVVYALPLADEVRHFEARLVSVDPNEIVVIVRDVTDQKRAEDALRRSERALRQSHRRIQQLAGRLIAAQEDERSRLARELHDDLSQKLALLSMGLDQLSQESGTLEQEYRGRIRELTAQAAEVARDVHRLSYALHPSTVATLGVVTAVQQHCAEVAAKHECTIDFTHDGMALQTSPEVVLCAFRIVQEALQNAAKHSGTDRMSVHLASDDRHLLLHVADEGLGFNVEDGERRGLGLVSMRERVDALGGQFAVRSSPDRGTRVDVRLPLSRRHAD